MSNIPEFAKISPEITEIVSDTLTNLGFQLIKSEEISITLKKGNLLISAIRSDFGDFVRVYLIYENLSRGTDFGPHMEYFFTGDYPVTKLIWQQVRDLKTTDKYQSWDSTQQREQINLILIKHSLELVKQFLPEIENNFDPEKYFAWHDANLNMPFKV